MLNHFRTLLLNLSYFEPSEHIPEGFNAKVLPQELQKLYDKLFPPRSTRFYRFFLAKCYLKAMDTVGYTSVVTSFDSRISYDVESVEYFKVHRRSNPVVSVGNDFSINVLTELGTATYSTYNHDTFLIEQIDDTNQIRILSKVKNVYLNGKEEYTNGSDSNCYITVAFSGDAKTSDPIYIGQTGVIITFTNESSGNFTTVDEKTWEFIIEAPYKFDLIHTINELIAIDPFTTLKNFNVDITQYNEDWEKSFNPVHKLAAFLAAYVTVINKV